MSTTTTNLELIKPEATDNVSLSDYNFNLDTIDTAIHNIEDNMVDYIIERGTTGIWTWEKYQSGIVKCWGNTKLNYSNVGAQTEIPLPFAFSEIPVAVLLTIFDILGWRLDKVYNHMDKTTRSKICPIGFTSNAEFNGVYNTSIYVIGKWK